VALLKTRDAEIHRPLIYARGFRELIVYQKSRAVAREIFNLTKSFPREETFSLTDQVRRSSRAIGAQITEAWAKRRYPKHFVSKLTDADGEQQETQHWVESCLDSGYLSAEQIRPLIEKLTEIGKMLGSMIAKADTFCGADDHTVREFMAEYGSATDY
jgi:four helix bundle protein